MSILSNLKQIHSNTKHLTLPSKISYCKAIVKLYIKYLYYLYLKRKYKKRLLVVTYLGYSDWDKVISQSILEKRSNENKIVLALYGEDINFYDSFTFEWQFVDYHTNSSLSKFAPDNSLIPSKLVDMGVLLTNPIYNSNKVKHTNYIFSISSTTIRPITPLEKELIE